MSYVNDMAYHLMSIIPENHAKSKLSSLVNNKQIKCQLKKLYLGLFMYFACFVRYNKNDGVISELY